MGLWRMLSPRRSRMPQSHRRKKHANGQLQYHEGKLGSRRLVSFLSYHFVFFFSPSSASAIPSIIPDNVAERLAKLEASRLADQEVIAELAQKMARLESENRTMREWSSDRLMAIWETSNGRDVNIVQALHNIHAVQVEEHGRQIQLQRTTEHLEALLRSTTLPPPAAQPTHNTELTVTPVDPPLAAQEAEPPFNSPTSPEDPEGEIPSGESKKRGRSVSSKSSGSSKRQKL